MSQQNPTEDHSAGTQSAASLQEVSETARLHARQQHEYLLAEARNRRKISDDRLITLFAFVLTVLLMFFASLFHVPTEVGRPTLDATLVFPAADDIAQCTKQCTGSLLASVRTLYKMGINCSYVKMYDTVFITIGGNRTVIDCAERCAAKGWVVA